MNAFRTGDVVRHKPSGEKWIVAWASSAILIPCGWPETIAQVGDCELIQTTTDQNFWKLVEEIATNSRFSLRAAGCRDILEARLADECAAMMHL